MSAEPAALLAVVRCEYSLLNLSLLLYDLPKPTPEAASAVPRLGQKDDDRCIH